MSNIKEQKLIDALEPVAFTHGFELVSVELSGACGTQILRVFIDKEGGIGIDELAEANLWVNAIVEQNEPFAGAYTLEVSSPGIDRPLRTPEHFARFVGEEVKISTESIDGRANWAGTLAGVEGADSAQSKGAGDQAELVVLLAIEGETHRLPFAKIKKAHVKARIDFKRAQG